MSDPSSRMLQLLSLLQTHRHRSAAELAETLGVTTRTVRRDVDRLRELGYPVAAFAGAAGGYRLEAGRELPPLLLDDDEAVAMALGLRTAAAATVAGIEDASVRALAKLERVLPSRLRRRVSALHTFTIPLTTPTSTVDPEVLATLALACRDAERLRFRYRARDEVATRRTVEPHRLVSAGRRWYLLAWDAGREDWRTFRVDRLEQVSSTGTRFVQREVPGGDPAAFVADAIHSAFSTHRAVVRLHAPAEVLAERVPASLGELEPDGEHCVLRATTDSLEWLAAILGVIGAEFDIVEPEALSACVRDMGERLRRASA